MDSFLPEGYEDRGSGYMKLTNGEHLFRVMTKAVGGKEIWDNGKPVRYRYSEEDKASEKGTEVRDFWAFVVWNYDAQDVQILEITQSSIKKAIKRMMQDAKWGEPWLYDIKVLRQGEKMETRYMTLPVSGSKRPITDVMRDRFNTKPCCLDCLFSGEDPWNKAFAPTPLAG